ncbi:hypothetical protein [Mycobacteroides abscessus]|uniref:hypothetical protein n=1 Tax=Mycobacteroides abscessus TaxID=36809 RepID=UPI0009A6236E|nr:hypothetical protein [Mycobacteroides abscessus]SLF39610.1 Uncharacterised protein [Mycobacteroides abscessus subsp. bolletii]
MNAQGAISRIIASIPNLLSATVTERFTGKSEHVVYSQERVAEAIAAVLPANLKAEGYLLVRLANVETDDTGRRSVRVPITAQPWADGEVLISPRGDQVAIRNVPDVLPMQDIPALASALMAAYSTWRPPRR